MKLFNYLILNINSRGGRCRSLGKKHDASLEAWESAKSVHALVLLGRKKAGAGQREDGCENCQTICIIVYVLAIWEIAFNPGDLGNRF